MNDLYRDLVLARIHGAVAMAEAYVGIEHSLLKGELREMVIRELFRPLFPADIGVGTGVIVSAENDEPQSPQQDVVIYDRSILPPLLAEMATGLFPLESVLITVEVKSKLTLDELKTTHASAQCLGSLTFQPGFYDERDRVIDKPRADILPCLLAFATDLVEGGKTEIARYDEMRDGEPPSIGLICVVGRGCWYWNPERGCWFEAIRGNNYDEVVIFLTILLNTYPSTSEKRGQPRLGRYLHPIGERIFKIVE
jgi:hypothetical protein